MKRYLMQRMMMAVVLPMVTVNLCFIANMPALVLSMKRSVARAQLILQQSCITTISTRKKMEPKPQH